MIELSELTEEQINESLAAMDAEMKEISTKSAPLRRELSRRSDVKILRSKFFRIEKGDSVRYAKVVSISDAHGPFHVRVNAIVFNTYKGTIESVVITRNEYEPNFSYYFRNPISEEEYKEALREARTFIAEAEND